MEHGWWLMGDYADKNRDAVAFSSIAISRGPARSGGNVADVRGATKSWQEALAWVRDGKLPKNAAEPERAERRQSPASADVEWQSLACDLLRLLLPSRVHGCLCAKCLRDEIALYPRPTTKTLNDTAPAPERATEVSPADTSGDAERQVIPREREPSSASDAHFEYWFSRKFGIIPPESSGSWTERKLWLHRHDAANLAWDEQQQRSDERAVRAFVRGANFERSQSRCTPADLEDMGRLLLTEGNLGEEPKPGKERA
jgi:hypothetical protein